MPFVRVWIHAVWSTKRRHPFLVDPIRSLVFGHMVNEGRSKGIQIDRINGYLDHAHMLFNLSSVQSISRIINQVKGESSHWINQHQLILEPFNWQDEYYAVSVSESGLAAVRSYIDKQEEHHRHRSFQEEYDDLLRSIPGQIL